MSSGNQVTAHGHVDEHEAEHDLGGRFYFMTWLSLLVITMVEVGVVAWKLDRTLLVAILLGLTVLKAGVIVANFMHVRFEVRPVWYYVVIPPFIIALAVFLGLHPDFTYLKWGG